MNYSVNQLKEQFDKLGYQWPKFHLIGIRSKKDLPNQFDDKFYLISGDNCYVYTGTTNPGTYWLKNPMQKIGAAVLAVGQHFECWKLGLHRGVYKAWVQAKPVTVYRDNDKDDKSENNGVSEKGLFGINVHRASEKWISKLIDRWSAGCQVLNNPAHYSQFIKLSEQSGQKLFTVTILSEF